MNNIAVIGLWHQGIVATACFADWGYFVTGFDDDTNKISQLNDGRAPIFEPGLDDLLTSGLESKKILFLSKNFDKLKDSTFVILAFDTPVNNEDISDLSNIFSTVREIAPYLANKVLIHVTAQVPVGTCDLLSEIIREIQPNLKFSLAYTPENLRLGQAIDRFRHPMLPIIGCECLEDFDRFKSFYAACKVDWQFCDLRTAEMTKHALNSFLALSVAFANELGNLCDEVGADGHRVAELLRMEPRVGSKAMLFPGLGFSGGTLARDIQTLRAIGDSKKLSTILLDGIWEANKQQNNIVLRRLKENFGGSLEGLRIGVLGLTYKPETSTLRRSAAIEIIAELVRNGAKVRASDPMADRNELKNCNGFEFFESADDALLNVDALILITPWEAYKSFDFKAAANLMHGRYVFDTANIWNMAKVQEAGLVYVGIGSGGNFRIKS
jgi:UDPglucose 6-dehydrogenase